MSDLELVKRQAGRGPFERRLRLKDNFAACPFHTGDSDKSMHLYKRNDGTWAAKCFSTCNKSWDAIEFVMEFDSVDFAEALRRIGGKVKSGNWQPETMTQETTAQQSPPPKPAPMKAAEFAEWGRDLTPADVDRFARGRKSKGYTADFEAWRNLGCRIKGDYIGFPYRHPNGEFLYTLKLRHLDKKDFTAENAAANDGFFNLDTVNEFEPVYIVEGEPDVAVLEEMGYPAVGLLSASQAKFDKHALAVIATATEIYIIGDQPIPKRGHDDDPGAKCIDKLEAALEAVPGVARKLYRIRFAVDGIEREKELKDVSALRAHYGADDFRRRFEELKAKAQEWTWVDENIPQVSAISDSPQPWLVERMLPYGGLTVLCGEQGATKSLLALWLAKYLTAPKPKTFLGRKIEGRATSGLSIDINGGIFPLRNAPVAPVPVLYIDRENPKFTAGERRGRVGIIGRDNFRYWGDWLAQENLSANPQVVFPPEPDDPRVLKWAMQTRGFIVFDSLQQWYGDSNENSNTDMGKLMNKFKRLSRLCAGVLVLHHAPKPSTEGPKAQWRGATAIVAIPEMSISLGKETVDGEEIFALRPIRFRCCAPWHLDFKVNWNADGQGNYAIAVAKDKLVSELAAESKAQKESKATEKLSQDTELSAKLDAMLSDNPNTPLAKLGVHRDRAFKVVAGKWNYNADADPKWTRAESLSLVSE